MLKCHLSKVSALTVHPDLNFTFLVLFLRVPLLFEIFVDVQEFANAGQGRCNMASLLVSRM